MQRLLVNYDLNINGGTMKIKQNPDKKIADDIKKKLRDNDGYCPCSLLKNEETKCICREFLEMAEGLCHCGLYIKIAD